MNGGTTDTARANGAENNPGFRSRTVRVARHELVATPIPDIPVPRVPMVSTPGSMSTNWPPGSPGLIGVLCNFASNSNALVKITDARFDVVR